MSVITFTLASSPLGVLHAMLYRNPYIVQPRHQTIPIDLAPFRASQTCSCVHRSLNLYPIPQYSTDIPSRSSLATMDKELEELELLSLVNKVSQEIFNFTGSADQDLAKFVIAVSLATLLAAERSSELIPASVDRVQLHRKSKKFDVFQTKMKEMGAPFPDSFVQNLDRIILSMHPKYKKKAKKAQEMTVGGGEIKGKDKDIDRVVDEETDRRARLFPGLAVPDSQLKSHDQFLKDERNAGPVLPDVDDLMKELEGVGSKRRTEDAGMEDNGYKRQRVEDDGYAQRGRGRSPPTQTGRSDGRDSGYGTRLGAGPGGKNGYDGRGRQDDKPVLYKIYNGRVSNIKDFGCFVTLEGISGRQEGMVHISSMASSRVNSPADLVTRNQPVKVKVMSIAGSKVSLSMKDVDQSTGADLSYVYRASSFARSWPVSRRVY